MSAMDTRTSGDPVESIKTVMFYITEACNLRCTYCYEQNRTRRRMSANFIQKLIEKHMAEEELGAISFDFFGGEPLLEFDTIRSVVEWFHQREWPKSHRFTVSTNGTLLTDEMKQWFTHRRECVIPLLSLDGTRDAHNRNRSGSYDQVIRHLDFFRGNWPDEGVHMTVCPQTIDQVADGIIHIQRDLELRVESSLVFEDVWGGPQQQERVIRIYEQQLERLIEFYDANPELPVPLILNRRIEGLLAPPEPERPYCGAGRYMVCYSSDGAAYPCHRYAPVSSSRPTMDPDGDAVPFDLAGLKCMDCALVPICPTCAGHNWEANAHSQARTTFHCEFLKREALASAKLLIRRIKAQMERPGFGTDNPMELMKRLLGVQKLARTLRQERDSPAH